MQTKVTLISVIFLWALVAVANADESECEDATYNAESASSELADYARKLQQCAESEDYSDDCSIEFHRVRSAYDDYESAVSEVSSYCE